MTNKNSIYSYVNTSIVIGIALSSFLFFSFINQSNRIKYWFNAFDGFGLFFIASAISTIATVYISNINLKYKKIAILLPYTILVLFFIDFGAIASVLIQSTSATLIGFAVLSRIWIKSRTEKALSNYELFGIIIFSLTTGKAIFATSLWALSHFPVNYDGVHVLFYLTAGILSVATLKTPQYELVARIKGQIQDINSTSKIPLTLTPGLISVFALITMTALPELGSDARAAYASFFEHMRFNGHWHHDPSLAAWGIQPLGGLYLAGSAYLMAGEDGARLQNAAMMIIGLGNAALIAGIISQSRQGAAIAFSIIATIPLLLEITAEFYYDNTVAAFTLGAVAALLMSLKSKANSESLVFIFILALTLAGSSATKHTSWIITIAFGIYASTMFLLKHEAPIKSIISLIVIGFFSFIFLVFPISIFSYIVSDNPVFPYYNQFFQSPFYPPEQHSTPHTGFVGWNIIFASVFDTQTFSSSDMRGAFGVAVLLCLPAILVGSFAKELRLHAVFALFLLGLFCLLSAMQNDLRLLWPISAALIATSVGIITKLTFEHKWSNRLQMVSLTAIAGLQLVLMPTGSHAVPGANVLDAINPREADLLRRQRTPTTIINSMLDNLPDRMERRLYLSTLMGPYSAISVEDGWYTFLARIRIHRSNSEDQMMETLRAIAPDAIVLGARGHRRWLHNSIYRLINQHSLQVFDYSDHHVFLMNNTVSYPIEPIVDEESIAAINNSSAGGIYIAGDQRQRLNFLKPDMRIDRFRIHFNAQCETLDMLHIIVAVRGPGKLHEYTLTQRPCQGEDNTFTATATANIPADANRVTIELKTRSGETPLVISNVEAGFKPVFDRTAALEL